MGLLQIKEIKKEYDDKGVAVEALRGIQLSIEKGEFTAIAGPSGSGKTTLLNIISGLDYPTEGRIIFDNRELTSLPSKDLADIRLKKMGFIFQAYNLIPVLTALENVEFVMLLQKVEPEARRARAKRMLDEVGLAEYYGRRPYNMSGGQQQRVAVARAVVTHPNLILADEPTANLDSETATKLLDTMRKLNREKNITFLFSTHDNLVMDKADRLVHIRDGQIIKEG